MIQVDTRNNEFCIFGRIFGLENNNKNRNHIIGRIWIPPNFDFNINKKEIIKLTRNDKLKQHDN